MGAVPFVLFTCSSQPGASRWGPGGSPLPYQSVAELPPSQVDQYDEHQKEAFLKAFNHALEEYGGDEHRAFAVAHTAAKKVGEKERGGSVGK